MNKKKLAIFSGSLHSIPPTETSPAVPRNLFRIAEYLSDFYEVCVISFDKGEIECIDTTILKAKYIRIKNHAIYKVLSRVLTLLPLTLRKRYWGKANVKFLAYYFIASNILKKEKPDIVLTTMHIDAVPFMVRACPNARHFFYYRSSNLETESVNKLIKICSKLEAFISLTKDVKYYVDNNIVPHTKIKSYVIPNFINETLFDIKYKNYNRELFRKRFKFNEDDFVIGYAGRITSDKGIDTLLKVLANLRKKNKNIKLLIAGDKRIETIPEKRSLIEEISSFLLKEDVLTFTGWIPYHRMPEFYSALDIGILLSKNKEGHSMFALEAMAMGVPIIATQVGGNSEIIEHGKSGILIPQNFQASTLELYLNELISDKLKLNYLSTNAAMNASNFSFNKSSQLLLNALIKI